LTHPANKAKECPFERLQFERRASFGSSNGLQGARIRRTGRALNSIRSHTSSGSIAKMHSNPDILRLPARSPDHDLTLVIPGYNEEKRLPRTLSQVRTYLDQWGIDYRVIVVDDGSRDGTVAAAGGFGPRFSVISLDQNRGKGAAVRSGMLSATGRVAAFTDADLPYSLHSLRAGYELIRDGRCEVAFGARDVQGSRQQVRRRTLRRAASLVFSQIVRFLISRDVTDTQAGLKLFSARASRAIFSRTVIDGFAFDAEVVFLTHHLGFTYQRIAVELINEEASSLSVWRHTLPMLREVFQIRVRALRGAYEGATLAPSDDVGETRKRKAA
jgi:dolichyl-phosphate beta-glucosyltransferase